MIKKSVGKNKNKRVHLYCLVTILFVVLLKLGFSSFLTDLDVDSISAVFRLQEDVRVTNMSLSNTSSGATSNWEEYNVKNIFGSVILPNSDSTVTYEVEVTNVGNVKEGVFEINDVYKLNGVDTSNNLEIKSMSLNLKEALCDDSNTSKCTLGSVSTFSVTIGYKTGVYNGADINYELNIGFDFRRVYDISYVDFNSTSSLPTQMISGDSLNITFNSTTGIPVSVNVTGATANYNTSTSVLTLSDATDNIIVTGSFSQYSVITDNTTTTYDHNTLTANTDTTFNNIAGKPRVVVDENGKVVSFEYTDTGSSGITFAEGNSFDTGVDAFDSSGYTIHLKFKMDPYDNTGRMVLSAMKKQNGNKYTGFSLNVYSATRFYLYANTSGANINNSSFGTLIGTINVSSGEQTFSYDMTFMPNPNKSITSTLTPSTSGSPLTVTSNNLTYYPDTLEDTSIVLGGSIANHNKDIETMTILEFSINKI